MSFFPSVRRILVPEGWAESPLFKVVEAADTVEATILFGRPLTEAQLDDAERAVLAWFSGAKWGGSHPILVDETLTELCLHVAVTEVRTAQDAFGRLLDALAGVGVPVARAVFVRLRADGDRDALVRGMDPSARPQVEYDDPREWWDACFDLAAAPPISEDRAELAHDYNALLEMGKTTYAEHRGLPLHVADMRICYGLGDAIFDDADGGRGADVARALGAALDEYFSTGDGGGRPTFFNHLLQPDAPLDRLRAGGRSGYSCAFRSSELREFLHDHLYRYREYELMLAMRAAARALDLEQVVCWRRFSGKYVVQLWERGASLIHQAA